MIWSRTVNYANMLEQKVSFIFKYSDDRTGASYALSRLTGEKARIVYSFESTGEPVIRYHVLLPRTNPST